MVRGEGGVGERKEGRKEVVGERVIGRMRIEFASDYWGLENRFAFISLTLYITAYLMF